MGIELVCSARYQNKAAPGGAFDTATGKAHLESDEVIFRGNFRVVIKFTDLTEVEVNYGRLRLITDAEVLELDLGAQAQRWADKITSPKSLIDKLGVKPGQSVAIVGIDDATFIEQLTAVTPPLQAMPPGGLDFLFYGANTQAQLDRLTEIRGLLKPSGAVWVVSRKGKAATVKDVDVISAGRKAGFVDHKVASFSDTHTALKFVIPVKERRA